MDRFLGRTAGDVLVVDDDPNIVTLVVELLTEEGYTVRCAADGLAAWQAIGQAPPALLVTDIRMPVMWGTELVTRLRTNGYDLPIVLVAATPQLAEPIMHLERVTFLAKPFALDALLDCVEQHVAPLVAGPRSANMRCSRGVECE